MTTALVTGCSGDGGGAAKPSPGSASPITTWRPGEFTTVPRVCDAISAETRHRLRVERTGFDASCYVQQGDGDNRDHVHRTLGIQYEISRPFKGRSATDEAKNRFRNLPEFRKLDPGVPVRGLGDEAELVRQFDPAVKRRRVVLAVRGRNVVVQIDVDVDSSLDRYRARVQPLHEIEAGALAAARDVLAGLGAAPAPQPTPADGPGETRSLRRVCAAVTSAGRLVPGLERRDISPAGSALGGGCHWSRNDGRLPDLTVDAEVIPPSPLTGETGSRIAATAFRRWKGDGGRVGGLGDEAKTQHIDFRGGEHRLSEILVRRGNLLVYVGYGRWNHPSRPTMDKEVRNIAAAVLRDQR